MPLKIRMRRSGCSKSVTNAFTGTSLGAETCQMSSWGAYRMWHECVFWNWIFSKLDAKVIPLGDVPNYFLLLVCMEKDFVPIT